MLGDTGANVLGAVLGLAVVLEAAPATRVVVAIVLLAANLAVGVRVLQSRHRTRRAAARVRRPRPGGDVVKRLTAVLALVLVAVGVLARAGLGRDGCDRATPIRRVFVFSMPGVTWSELDTVELPNIEGFLADSAVASLAPARVVAHRPGPADAYVTFGAGHSRRRAARRRRRPVRRRRDRRRRARPARSSNAGPDAIPRAASCRWGSRPCAGRTTRCRTTPSSVRSPTSSRCTTSSRAVIANADGVEGPGSDDRHREAALALVDGGGVVENGQVGSCCSHLIPPRRSA